ncbi:MAG TPA: hypothetical protein VGS61_06100 [Acidimicrobiales bacterium]|nr:hypothetical protein [Acidimicrobiales bacterium]
MKSPLTSRSAKIAAVVGVLAAVALPALPSSGAPGGYAIHYLDMKGAHGQPPASGNNLIDHGGPVLSAAHTYTIWWGPSSSWTSDVAPGIANFFSGVNKSQFLNTATQYMRGPSASSTPGATSTWADPTSPPKKSVSPATLGAEVSKALSAGQLGGSVDPNGIYFVYTSNFPRGGNFCAWHSDVSVGGHVVSVAYMPNTTGVAGCNPNATTGQSEGLASLANVTSHEFMESITDPQLNAWYDGSGSEIGDKCAWMFSGTTTFGGTAWYLQMEWSNAVSGCVLTTP